MPPRLRRCRATLAFAPQYPCTKDVTLAVEPIPRTNTSEYIVRGDGVIVQRIVSRERQTLHDARENARMFNLLAGGRKRQLIVDMQVPYSTGPGVREFYASEEGSRYVSALAMVTYSTTTSMIGNFFLSINRPSYPCRMFTNLASANGWLRTLRGD